MAGDGVATLGGVVARIIGDKVWLYREPAGVLGRAGLPPREPAMVGPGDGLLWDGRFIIRNNSDREISVASSRMTAPAPNAPRDVAFAAPVVAVAGRVTGSAVQPPPAIDIEFLGEERFFRQILRFERENRPARAEM